MLTTRSQCARKFLDLDYARHLPKEYVKRMRREVPKKIYDDRFGAPDITRWELPPGQYEPSHLRPWQQEKLHATLERAQKYHQKQLLQKFFQRRINRITPIPDEKWFFFMGDRVQVMVGKDKGKQGSVSLVSRETNEVIVDGLHTKFEKEVEGVAKLGMDESYRFKEQPLDISKQQVMLVDPNDYEVCEARWDFDSNGNPFRVSCRSGFEIPIPAQAYVTYEYIQPEKYIEVESKDTPATVVLERTYTPKLASFEDEIMQEMGIVEKRQRKPKYWY